MPDYAACQNRICPRRVTCARYLMVYGHWQTVGGFKAEGCTHYVDVSKDPPWHVHKAEDVDKRLDAQGVVSPEE